MNKFTLTRFRDSSADAHPCIYRQFSKNRRLPNIGSLPNIDCLQNIGGLDGKLHSYGYSSYSVKPVNFVNLLLTFDTAMRLGIG